MPRYSPCSIGLSPLPALHHHRRPCAGHRPAQIRTQLRILHLAAAPFPIVISMLARAVGSERTGIVYVAAQLAHVLNDHIHAVGVAFAEMPTRGIVRTTSAELDDATRDVLPTLPLLAEAVVLKLQHGGEGKRIIGASQVDLLRPHAGIRPQDVLGVVARDR